MAPLAKYRRQLR